MVATLESRDLDALYDAEQRYRSDLRGDNATKEFVLRHVFGIVPELIVNPSDLLTVLLRRHCAARRIPPLLDEHFIELIQRTDRFPDWPLDAIVPDRDAFLAFLQERWPVYLDRSARSALGVEREPRALRTQLARARRPAVRDTRTSAPTWTDCSWRGQLRPVPHGKAAALSETWVAVGLHTDETADELRRMDRLLDAANEAIPEHDDRHDRWFHFAATWAELVALTLALNSEVPDDERRKVETLRSRVDTAFAKWIEKRYPGLVNLPPVPPVMLHHLPRLLARDVHDSPRNKVALLVIDGLALDQWIVVRRELAKQRPDYRFHEGAVFAWMPTLTSVSRQAAFAGRAPLYFPESIHSTDREPALWRRFWADEGMEHAQVLYARSLGSGIPDDVAGVDRPSRGPRGRPGRRHGGQDHARHAARRRRNARAGSTVGGEAASGDAPRSAPGERISRLPDLGPWQHRSRRMRPSVGGRSGGSARRTRPRVPGCGVAPECGQHVPGRTRMASRRVAGRLPSAPRPRPIGIRTSRPAHRGARWRLHRGAHRPSRQN